MLLCISIGNLLLLTPTGESLTWKKGSNELSFKVENQHAALSHHISPRPLRALTPLGVLKECADKSEVLQGQRQGTGDRAGHPWCPSTWSQWNQNKLEELRMSTEVTYPCCWMCCLASATFLPATRVKTFFYLGSSSMAVMWGSLLPMGPGPTFPWCFQPNFMQGTRLWGANFQKTPWAPSSRRGAEQTPRAKDHGTFISPAYQRAG